VFDIAEKSSRTLPEIITLVSSVNKMDSDKVFIVAGRSFIYIKKSKDVKIDPWRTPCFTVPHFEENLSNDFISVFLFSICQIGSEPVRYFSLNAIIMLTLLAIFHDLQQKNYC
jgi:hypothetical protein